METNCNNQGLEKVRIAFNRYRQDFPNKNKYFPEELKILVMESRGAFKIEQICEASGVSRATVSRWCEKLKWGSAKQLKVIRSRAVKPQEIAKASIAKVSIGQHLSIDVPIGELSEELLEKLFELGLSK
jgi:transcriptional regulator with XRE-family HTH domain